MLSREISAQSFEISAMIQPQAEEKFSSSASWSETEVYYMQAAIQCKHQASRVREADGLTSAGHWRKHRVGVYSKSKIRLAGPILQIVRDSRPERGKVGNSHTADPIVVSESQA